MLIITDKTLASSGGTGYFLVDPALVGYAESGDKAYLNIAMSTGDAFAAADRKLSVSPVEPD